MLTSRSCSWCDAMNLATARTCSECGHDAHVCRLDCTCPRCARARHQAARCHDPIPLAGVVAEALAGLRRNAMQESEPAGESCPTRGLPRAAVSAKLAALIHAVDAAMTVEFGTSGFGFAVFASDGLIAARNPPDGFVVPLVTMAAPATPPADS